MIADKACYERGCACYDPRENDGVEVIEKKPWVSLTKEQRNDFAVQCGSYETVCEIEAKLMELNNGN